MGYLFIMLTLLAIISSFGKDTKNIDGKPYKRSYIICLISTYDRACELSCLVEKSGIGLVYGYYTPSPPTHASHRNARAPFTTTTIATIIIGIGDDDDSSCFPSGNLFIANAIAFNKR